MKIVDNILQPAREQAYISHTITGGKIMATKTANLTGAQRGIYGSGYNVAEISSLLQFVFS